MQADTLVAALGGVAAALAALHDTGRVYYALKASDVIYLEGLNLWALSDFSATVPVGAQLCSPRRWSWGFLPTCCCLAQALCAAH